MAETPVEPARASRSFRALEPPPRIGKPIHEHPGVFRVVAANPGPMTYHGTNTWFVEIAEPGGPLALIDPGPDDDAHLAAIIAAGAGRITHLLVSHAHGDHIALAPRLSRALDLPIHAHRLVARVGIEPGIPIDEGFGVGRLTSLHTPGHASDHLCFAYDRDTLFTADHVMGWSTSVVPPPPEGSASRYLSSLRRLLERDDRLYFSGHGPLIENPHRMVASLLAQRQRREREIADLVLAGNNTIDGLLARLYPALKPGLDFAARANVAGHLARLEEQAVIEPGAVVWRRDQPTPPAF